MGEVFRKASRVVVWLGEDPATPFVKRDVELIIEVLQRVHDAAEDPSSVFAAVRAMVTVGYPCYHWDTEQRLRWRTIAELFRRPWFSRTWVFQEASLVKDVMFLYGSVPMSFRTLHRLGIAVVHLERERGLEGLIDELRGIASGTAGLEMLNLIEDARRDLQSQLDPLNPYDPHRFLCKLLAVLRRVRCTDPRDLIYAFLADHFRSKAPGTLSYQLDTYQLDLMRTLLADGAMAERQKLLNLHDLLATMQRSDEAVKSWYERHPTDRGLEEERLVASYRELQDLAYVAECKRVFFTEHAQLGMAAE